MEDELGGCDGGRGDRESGSCMSFICEWVMYNFRLLWEHRLASVCKLHGCSIEQISSIAFLCRRFWFLQLRSPRADVMKDDSIGAFRMPYVWQARNPFPYVQRGMWILCKHS